MTEDFGLEANIFAIFLDCCRLQPALKPEFQAHVDLR